MWNNATITIQILCTIWFIVTHWISLPPLNDLTVPAFTNERKTNLALTFIQIASIFAFILQISVMMWIGTLFWTLSLVGHITSWWLPYFFGWPKAFLENAEEDNEKTYHFLPARKNHPIPDFVHCILGILILASAITSWGAVLYPVIPK